MTDELPICPYCGKMRECLERATARLNSLNDEYDQISCQYDQISEKLAETEKRLATERRVNETHKTRNYFRKGKEEADRRIFAESIRKKMDRIIERHNVIVDSLKGQIRALERGPEDYESGRVEVGGYGIREARITKSMQKQIEEKLKLWEEIAEWEKQKV